MLWTNGNTLPQERHPFDSLSKIIKGFCIPESEQDSDDTTDEPVGQLVDAVVVDDDQSESIEISLSSKDDDHDAPVSPAISASGKEMYMTPECIRDFKPELMETDAIDDVSVTTETSSPKTTPSPTSSPVSLYSGRDGHTDEPVSILKSPLEKAKKKKVIAVESGRQLRVTRIIETAVFTLLTVGLTIFLLFQVENHTEFRFDSSHTSFPVQFNFRESIESFSTFSWNHFGTSLGLREGVLSVPKEAIEKLSLSYAEVEREQKEEIPEVKGIEQITEHETENEHANVMDHETKNDIEEESKEEPIKETEQEMLQKVQKPETISEVAEVAEVKKEEVKEEAKLEGDELEKGESVDTEKEQDVGYSVQSEYSLPEQQDERAETPDTIITSFESNEEELEELDTGVL